MTMGRGEGVYCDESERDSGEKIVIWFGSCGRKKKSGAKNRGKKLLYGVVKTSYDVNKKEINIHI
jgi:hypothetical protein